MPQQYVVEAGHAPGLSVATTSDLSDLSCGVCHKRYVRQCDLNKHYKTHSRPFKCPVPGCKFQERGWPTEKELLRHQNDKHSESPRVFRCRFQPCDYTSKRESNCKQHMEKNHGWHYVRSRPPRQSLPSGANTSRRLESQEQEDSSPFGHAEDDGAAEPADPPVFPWVHQPHTSPLDPRLHAPEVAANSQAISHGLPVDVPSDAQEPLHDLEENLDSADKESEVFLPWDSPPTKLKKMETVLAQLPPSLFVANAAAWPAPPDATPGGAEPMFSPHIKVAHSPVSDIMPPAPFDASCSGIGGYGDYPDCGQVDFGGTIMEHKAKHEHGHHYKRSVDHISTGAILGTDTRDGPAGDEDADGDLDSRQDEDAEGDEDEDGDDDPPPRKKAKASLEDDFNDAEMECPFRLANPDVYKRERNSRYSPCYTTHTQISTIVRHFKRAAHRLTVEDLYISSFDAPSDAGIRHPAAGLCRKCWRAFADRGEFSRHVSERSCSRASRSKREKFRLLHDTFCVALPDERPPTSSSTQAMQPAGSRPLPPTTAIVYQDGYRAPPITAFTAPAPTQPSPTNPAARQAGTSQSLTERVEALEQTTTQLLRMVTQARRAGKGKGKAGLNPPSGPPKPKRLDGGGAGQPHHQLGDLASALTSRRYAEGAEREDPSIYDYDAAYDAFKAPARNTAAASADAERKPQYMASLKKMVEVRERDRKIAEDKKMKREREAEGDEFAGKEMFVTEAYKRQQEENRRLEEEERRREEEEARRNKSGGMTGFYKQLLDRGDQRHADMVRAAEELQHRKKTAAGDDAAAAVAEEEEDKSGDKSAAEKARRINEEGGDVAINEEGQVVDKRELLKGGLNVVLKKKQPADAAAKDKDRDRDRDRRDHGRGGSSFAGSGGGKQAMRDRQSRMLEAQYEQALKRSRDEAVEERAKVELAAKSQKTASDISSAKERYLARKKAAAEAKAQGLAGEP
ncbi:hypothetical protein MAPG_07972 [Magnaporthiopsis poae ATCC 64411]|uniref:C2H2-type domain-containing protein n=1 Tax=Magnaporthiopsis poae (strain ATCC 64411 / 73-15) TaxID=644358 RepID=A0A0C4E641_MAGP6|nr:hypothetical protein MAPG_07972 [Magnaporthiopsis poae ATCC 64411]